MTAKLGVRGSMSARSGNLYPITDVKSGSLVLTHVIKQYVAFEVKRLALVRSELTAVMRMLKTA